MSRPDLRLIRRYGTFIPQAQAKTISAVPVLSVTEIKKNYAINECPLNKIDVLDSAKNTTPVFVVGRVSGEGRDCSRAMYNFTQIQEDKSKHYLELDSVELGIIDYLNKNFDDVVVIINSSNAIEMGWLKDYENVNSVLFVPVRVKSAFNRCRKL